MEDSGNPIRLSVEGLSLIGRHGVYDEEKAHGNQFCIDVVMTLDAASAVKSDLLEDTIDVAAVVRVVRDVNQQRQFNLIESFADVLAQALLSRFQRIDSLLVRVKKIAPPDLEGAACVVETMKTRA